MWVKPFGSDKVVVGISDALSLEIVPTDIELPKVGESFNKGDTLGALEGQKLNIDIISPISGSISQVNTYLPGQANPEGIHALVDDPYGAGWLVLMLLRKPDELKSLLSWTQYVALTAK